MKYQLLFGITLLVSISKMAFGQIVDDKQQFIQAQALISATSTEVERKKGFDIFQQLANRNYVKAINAIGICKLEGLGVAVDFNEGIAYLEKAAKMGYAEAYFNLGNLFKDKPFTLQNFTTAFNYYKNGADLGHVPCIYAKGYLLFKGFGCSQNYFEAISHFKVAAQKNMPQAMYFLGLCFRNGYGIKRNTDSARFWLSKALSNGEQMAIQELSSKYPENKDNSLTEFVEELKKGLFSLPKNFTKTNKVQKIETNISASNIEGEYEGYIFTYDWSGRHVVEKEGLKLKINVNNNNVLVGEWIEDNQRTTLTATLSKNNLFFKGMSYEKFGHYNQAALIKHSFINTNFNWQTTSISTIVTGDLQLFSSTTNEPSKPKGIFLKKVKQGTSNVMLNLLSDDQKIIEHNIGVSVYPNPFTQRFKLNFFNDFNTKVTIILKSSDGRVVYENALGYLEEGNYTIDIEPNNAIAQGFYLLQIRNEKMIKTIKLIKQ
jgi:uncharacterized protein